MPPDVSGEPTTEAGKGHDHYTQHASFCAFRAAIDGPCTCHLTEQIVAIEAEAREQGAAEERARTDAANERADRWRAEALYQYGLRGKAYPPPTIHGGDFIASPPAAEPPVEEGT